MKQLLRRLIIILLFILFSSLAWLTLTESGLHWVIQQSKAYLPGNLVAAKINGRLLGPVTLTKFEYRQQDTIIQADKIIFDLQPASLLSNNININRLHIQSLSIVLPDTDKTSSPQPLTLPELKLPWRVVLNDVKIDELNYKQNQKMFKLKQIRLDASSRLNQIKIKLLSISTETFKLDIKGKLQPGQNYQHNLQLRWQTELPSHVMLNGKGKLSGNMQSTQLKQTLSGPLQATMDAEFNNLLTKLSWRSKINISQLDASILNADLAAWSGNFELDAKGDLSNASASGELITDSTITPALRKLLEAKLKLKINWHDKGFNIEQFSYHSTQSQLTISGQVADTLKLDWSLAASSLKQFHPETSGQFDAQGKFLVLLMLLSSLLPLRVKT